MSTNTGPPLNLTKHDRNEDYDVSPSYTFSNDLFNIDSSIKSQKNTIDSNKTSLDSLLSGIYLSNLVYNAGFRIWQRGTSFTSNSEEYTADLWYKNASAEVYKASSSGFTNIISDNVLGLRSSSTDSIASVYNRISIGPLTNRTFTLSVYCFSSFANTTRIGIQEVKLNGLSEEVTNTTYSSYHSGNSSEEQLSVSLTITSSETRYLRVILLHENPSDTTTYSYFWDVMLTEGLYPSVNYLPKSYMEDLIYCRKHYRKIPKVYIPGVVSGGSNADKTHEEARVLSSVGFSNSITIGSVTLEVVNRTPTSYSVTEYGFNAPNTTSVRFACQDSTGTLSNKDSNIRFDNVEIEGKPIEGT